MGSKGSKGIQNRGPKLSELNRMAFKPRSSGSCYSHCRPLGLSEWLAVPLHCQAVGWSDYWTQGKK